MESSPVPSTPMSGVSLRNKWKFHPSTPEEGIRKKLFDFEGGESDNDLNQVSATSEYFSHDSSYMSETNHTDSFDGISPQQRSPSQKSNAIFITPNPSPSKCLAVSGVETPPPCLKKQRLFSPSSPVTPDKFPASFQSPTRPSQTISPRLFLDSSCDSLTALNEMDYSSEMGKSDIMITSPPRLERLQLLDYPRTPLSIARSSGLQMASNSSDIQTQHAKEAYSRVKRRVTRSGPEFVRNLSRGTNINPFTPPGLQNRTQEDENAPPNSRMKPQKRLAICESYESRYKQDFKELCLIGSGSFGSVYKCTNRMEGCIYALKRSHHPVSGATEAAALREVCAHAVLGSHPHLVRYYSAWAENNHMLIQNEYCDGGNLSQRVSANRYEGKMFGEVELKRILKHVSSGLQYIHSMGLVHMDIKPENIFISSVHDPSLPTTPVCMEAISEDPDVAMDQQQCVYKIGDMGHVTSISDPHVEEGDCRYLPREILQDNYSHLPKCDVFALGLTVFHAGSAVELPKNGSDWQRIRDGHLPTLQLCSTAFNHLLQVMIHADPTKRPSTVQLLSFICPSTLKSKAQLCKELNEEKFKNEILQRELQVARQESSVTANEKRLLNGPKLNRSMSIA